MFKFYILTFGCKVSQYESQAIRESWERLGGQECSCPEEAEVILVASCAVTAEGVSDARQAVRKLGRTQPQATIIVTGCAATAAPDDFLLPSVKAVIPQTSRHILLNTHPLDDDFPGEGHARDPQEAKQFPPFFIEKYRRARPVLKVQDGCSHGCTYCIVPLTRGPARSRPVDAVIAEAQRLLEAGHREIMVSGINLRQYRHEGQDFWDMLTRLNTSLTPQWQGKARLRLSSLEPAQLDAKGIDTLAACSMVCPHLHLSLQSGSASVLERMGRKHYDPLAIVEKMAQIRRFWPVFGLGADILMGFPGEDEAEVGETLALVSALPLTYAHVFPWSSRPGTKAALLPHHLPKSVRQEHAARIREVVQRKQEAFLHRQLDLSECLVAPDAHGRPGGVNEYYVPCILEGPRTGYSLIQAMPQTVCDGKIHALVRT